MAKQGSSKLSRSSVASGPQCQFDQSEVSNAPTRSNRHDSVANVALWPAASFSLLRDARLAFGGQMGNRPAQLVDS
jgi:hypothetical protein